MSETNDKKPGNYLKIGIIVAAVLVVLGVIIFAMKKEDDSSKEAAKNSALAGTEDAYKKDEKDSEKKNSFAIGEAAEDSGISLTLTSVIEAVGDDTIRPDEGNVFLICLFNVQNNSDEDITIQSKDHFEAVCDGNSIQQDIKGLQTPANDGKSPLDGLVAAGNEMEGVVVYQVPIEWKEVKINPSFDFWTSEEIQFIAEK